MFLMRTKSIFLLLIPLLFFGGARAQNPLVEGKAFSLVESCLEENWGAGMFTWEKGSTWRLDGISPNAVLKIKKPRSKPRGSTLLNLQVLKNGRVIKNVPLSIRVYAFAWVAQCDQEFSTRDDLLVNEFTWKRQEVTYVSGDWPKSASALNDDEYWFRRPIRRGEILTWNHIEKKPEVIRGDLVELISEVNGVRVSLPGVALQNGREGDKIKVENASNGTRLRGRVSGKAQVLIEGKARIQRG